MKKSVKKVTKSSQSAKSRTTLKKGSTVPDTMTITNEREIALDFAMKVYKEFDQMIKSVILFGSSAKKKSGKGSDIDILIIIDDVSIKWDMELIAWYREELGKLIGVNAYVRPLHINTMKLSTWWADLMRGDPVVLNVLRWGDPLVDFGGFFTPLKVLMAQGKIKSTPEAIYTLLQRAPRHLARARQSLLAAIDGYYWAMIDSAHAVLIAAGIEPASPEDIPQVLRESFVKRKLLHKSYVGAYEEVHDIAKEIIHGKRVEISGSDIDKFAVMSDDFLREMARLVDEILESKDK